VSLEKSVRRVQTRIDNPDWMTGSQGNPLHLVTYNSGTIRATKMDPWFKCCCAGIAEMI